MSKWMAELWRDGECVRRIEFTNDMIRQNADGSITITFPPHELSGGLVIATDDELHVSKTDDSES